MCATEQITLGDVDSEDDYECLEDYCLKITTDRGICDIIYRNSSNGYYGGYLETWDGNISGFTEITSDN